MRLGSTSGLSSV